MNYVETTTVELTHTHNINVAFPGVDSKALAATARFLGLAFGSYLLLTSVANLYRAVKSPSTHA